jgi:hypothetical protein
VHYIGSADQWAREHSRSILLWVVAGVGLIARGVLAL